MIRRALFVFGLTLLASPAQAIEPTAAEANVVPRVIEAVCVDLFRDHPDCETATLLRSETLPGFADLIVTARDGALLTVARDIAFAGDLPEQGATLEVRPGRVLAITSVQFAYGQYPWSDTIRLAEHDGLLQVVHWQQSVLDRARGGDFICDVDLTTGIWSASGERVHPETAEPTQTWGMTGQGHRDVTEATFWSFREPPTHCEGVYLNWLDAAP